MCRHRDSIFTRGYLGKTAGWLPSALFSQSLIHQACSQLRLPFFSVSPWRLAGWRRVPDSGDETHACSTIEDVCRAVELSHCAEAVESVETFVTVCLRRESALGVAGRSRRALKKQWSQGPISSGIKRVCATACWTVDDVQASSASRQDIEPGGRIRAHVPHRERQRV